MAEIIKHLNSDSLQKIFSLIKENYATIDSLTSLTAAQIGVKNDEVSGKTVDAVITELKQSIDSVSSEAIGITEGDGISITSEDNDIKKIAVKIKDNEKYLDLTNEDGLASKGIDDAISNAKTEIQGDADDYTDLGLAEEAIKENASAISALQINEAKYAEKTDAIGNAKYKDGKIVFTSVSGEEIKDAEIDCTDFIKDGMVDKVEVEDGKLVITFNTVGEDNEHTHKAIELEISKIFDASNYFTKSEITTYTGKTDSRIADIENAFETLTGTTLNDYATSSELENYVKKTSVTTSSTGDTTTLIIGDESISAMKPESVTSAINTAVENLASKTELAAKANASTTLDGYGIRDANINGNTITLGSNQITFTALSDTDIEKIFKGEEID